MKRALRVFGEPSDREPADAVTVAVGSTLISITDAHDGAMARRFGRMLAEAGGRAVMHAPSVAPNLRIVVRWAPESPEAHLRSEVLEDSADLVLGSARASLAHRLVNRLS